jgi:hypothetical protein
MAERVRLNAEGDLASDLLWGADSIARFIGRPLRQVYYLVESKQLPVRRLGAKTLVASKSELKAFLTGEAGRQPTEGR